MATVADWETEFAAAGGQQSNAVDWEAEWQAALGTPQSVPQQPTAPPPQQPLIPQQAEQQPAVQPAQQVEQTAEQTAEPEFSEYEFEGQTYRFPKEYYDTKSVERWFNTNVAADRRKLSREQAAGMSQPYDSEQEKTIRRSTPVNQQGLKEYAELLSGKDKEGKPVEVKPEEITPQALAEVVKIRKQQAEEFAKQENINPVKLREFNEDTAAMEFDLGRRWTNETSVEYLQRELAKTPDKEVIALAKQTPTPEVQEAQRVLSLPQYMGSWAGPNEGQATPEMRRKAQGVIDDWKSSKDAPDPETARSMLLQSHDSALSKEQRAADEAIRMSRPGYAARKEQPKEAFWAENLLREYQQEYGSEIPRDKKTAFDNANKAYDAWLKSTPKGADEEFDEWRKSKPIRHILHPEEKKRTAELEKDPHDRRYYDSLSEAMVAYHAYEAGNLDIVPYTLKRIPFAGTAVEAADFLSLRSAVKNIDEGKADDGDWFTLASAINTAEKSKDRSIYGKVWDLVSSLPGMGVEFAMTGGGFTAARTGARKLGVKLLGRQAMRSAIPRMATKAAGFATGVAGRTALNAPLVAAKVAQKWMPEYDLTRDEAGQLTASITGDDPSFMEALGKGFGAAYIEMGSEEAGALLGATGKALAKSKAGQTLAKMPLAQRMTALKAGLLNRFLAKGGTVEKANAILKKSGWNGMIGEVFEERIADVAGGVTGIEKDYGTVSKLLTNDPEGWEQLAVEAIAFAAIPVGQTALAASEAAMAPKDTRGPARGSAKVISARAATEVEKLRRVLAKGWVTREEAIDAGLSSEQIKNRGSRKTAIQDRIQQLEQEISDARAVQEDQGVPEEAGQVGEGVPADSGRDVREGGQVESVPQPAGEAAEGRVEPVDVEKPDRTTRANRMVEANDAAIARLAKAEKAAAIARKLGNQELAEQWEREADEAQKDVDLSGGVMGAGMAREAIRDGNDINDDVMSIVERWEANQRWEAKQRANERVEPGTIPDYLREALNGEVQAIFDEPERVASERFIQDRINDARERMADKGRVIFFASDKDAINKSKESLAKFLGYDVEWFREDGVDYGRFTQKGKQPTSPSVDVEKQLEEEFARAFGEEGPAPPASDIAGPPAAETLQKPPVAPQTPVPAKTASESPEPVPTQQETPQEAEQAVYEANRDQAVAKADGRFGHKVTPREPKSADEREIADFLDSRGKQFAFVDSEDPAFAGMVDHESGFVLLRGDREAGDLWETVGHELAHESGLDKVIPADSAELAAAREARLERAKGKDREFLESDSELLDREARADLVGQFLRDKGFRDSLARENPSLWERLREAILKVVGKWMPSDQARAKVIEELRQAPKPKKGRKGFAKKAETGTAKPTSTEKPKPVKKPNQKAFTDVMVEAGQIRSEDVGKKQYAYTFRNKMPQNRWLAANEISERMGGKDAGKWTAKSMRPMVDAGLLTQMFRPDGTSVYAWNGTQPTADLVTRESFEEKPSASKAPVERQAVAEQPVQEAEVQTKPPEGTAVQETKKTTLREKASARSERTAQALKDAAEELKQSFQTPLGFIPDPKRDAETLKGQISAAVKFAKAATDHGISKFSEYVAYVAENIGYDGTIAAGDILEMAWNKLRQRQGFTHLDEAGKTADVLERPVEKSEQQAEEQPLNGDDLTGIKKAVVNDLRTMVGLPEMEGSTPQSVQAWADQAESTLAADPNAAIRLVNELASNPRPISQHDAMLLQFRYRQLANELKPFVDEYFAAVASENPVAITTARFALANARSAMTEFEEVIHPSKETWGRAGVALQQMLRKDFSLEAVLRRGKEANNGQELSPEQVAELTQMAAKLEELQKRFDEQRRKVEELERELASKKQHEEVTKNAKKKTTQGKSKERQDAETRRKAAWENFKDKWAALGNVGAVYDPKAEAKKQAEVLSAAVELAKSYASEGFVRFSEFWTSIKGNIGTDASKAEGVFKEAWDQVKTEVGIPETELDLGDLKGLSKDARRIQRLLVESGMTEREEVIDAVHEIMSEDLPDMTRRQVMDALSQYSQFQTQSQVEIDKLIRDMNSEILKLSQIDQMEVAMNRVEELRKEGLSDEEIGNRLANENLLVKATGLVRDKPTETVRQLTKNYNELKKKIPATSEGRSGQLQTAQDSIVRALGNRIRDVRWELDHNERIVREKNATPDTELIRSLRAELDELLKIHREMFPPQRNQMTPEQKLAASERAATRLLEFMQKQEAAGFPPTPAKPKPLTSAQLETTQKQIAEIRKRRDAAQREGKRLDQLDEQIATLEERLRTGNIAPKIQPSPYTTPMIEARIARRKQLQAELETRQKKEMPELAEQRARKAYEASLRKRKADYLQLLADGDFSPKPKKEARTLSASELKLKREMEDVRHEVLHKYAEYHLAHMNGIEWTADKIMESAHLSRALMTSFDLSALLRQGGLPAMGHPILAKRALFETVASIAYTFDTDNALALRKGVTLENVKRFLQTIDSRQAEFDFMHKITNGADGEFRLRAGLSLPNTDEAITKQEEAFQGRWGKKVPGIAVSGRLYTMILNKIRADLFDTMVEHLGRGGQVTMDEAKIIASFINVATGRSDLKQFNKWAAILNAAFFAPRYVASRFQYLAMPFYLPFKGGLKANWRVKRAIYKEYARTAAGIGTVLGTFALLGMLFWDDDDDDKPTVEIDPRSADFLKVRIGDTRLDFLAGLSQTAVLSTRLLLPEALGGNRTKSSSSGKITKFGEGPLAQTKADVLARFARSKLAPIPGAVSTVWLHNWENVVGQKETPLSLAANLLLPLSLQDVSETMKTQGVPKTIAMSLLSILGVGMNTYGPKTQYVVGTEQERMEQFEKDMERMKWDSEQPAYSEFLTPEQLEQVESRIEEKKGSVLTEGLQAAPVRKNYKSDKSFQSAIKQQEKAQDSLQEMIKTLDLDHDEAQRLLLEYHRRPDRKEGNEFAGSTGNLLEEGYLARGIALAKLYGEPDPRKAFWAWRNRSRNQIKSSNK